MIDTCHSCLGTRVISIVYMYDSQIRSDLYFGNLFQNKMPTFSQLLGPPGVHVRSSPAGSDSTAMDTLASQTSNLDLDEKLSATSQVNQSKTEDSVMEDSVLSGNPPMGLTENLSPTFLATGNPCLDFFFHIIPDTPSDDLIRRLELAWSFDALMTLKLVCNLRGVRGTGKSDKEGFYTSAIWLYQNHPKTLAFNVRAIAEFGYFKDLVEILYRIIEGSDVRKIAKEEWRQQKRRNRFSRKMVRGRFKRENKTKHKISKEEEEPVTVDKEKARVLRKEREIAKAKKALEKYFYDSGYRFLHDHIADLFAELLKLDVQYLNAGETNKISLVSKWCPSIDSSFDKATLICESIAKRVFPKECDPTYAGIEEAHYVYLVRDRLRKQVLVPLHKALELPEIFMSANEWDSLPYNRVASVAMKKYKGLFSKHDTERFDEYLEKVKSGEAKIAAGALLPHEIIGSLEDEDGGKVAELQWARMVEDVLKKGKLTNCMAVCDVSGSMEGIPMEVSVALGLLVSELSEEPWKGKLITFSHDPQLHEIEGDSLLSKTKFIRRMDWGGNTDFQKVFDRILEVAVGGKLSEEEMIKRLFVFSDMEFDEASRARTTYWGPSGPEVTAGKWETDYQVIQRKFRENGYSKVPEIVFWNLRHSSATPVASNQSGVALLSGFSKNLLTMFIDGGGIVNPVEVMHLAISGEEYKKLVVFD